ncbi:ribonuclease domain-containing protein [Arthrobacter sp. SW1]|uniref:ribonuclease domain-containing protein n=1 Tax=Arthrobacter sp. SW1 TaxID=1920889 RepID=UPI00111322B9|nr:ribonuclease domain-containing protein [Arthrobacter sp. SW1]
MRLKGFLAIAGLAVAVVVLLLTGLNPGGGGNAVKEPAPTQSQGNTQATAPRQAPASNPSCLPEINASQLPAEARQTLALIAKGGPYPYSRDGVTFGNRERLLPRKPSGFYKEYTVRTPGESDRGARRIIAGKDGGKFYTPDHYASFSFIIEGK